VETLRALLDGGLDPALPDPQGLTPLHLFGLCHLDFELFDLMLDALEKAGKASEVAKSRSQDGNTVLHILMIHRQIGPIVARRRGGENPVDRLIGLGADLYAVNNIGSNCLHVAVARLTADPDLVLFLLRRDDAGKLIRARDHQGRTPVQLAESIHKQSIQDRQRARVFEILKKVRRVRGGAAAEMKAQVLVLVCNTGEAAVPPRRA
jgi:ankyrin repeat protein